MKFPIELGLPRKVINSIQEYVSYVNRYNGLKKAIFQSVYNPTIIEGKADYKNIQIDKLFFDFDTKDCWNECNKLHQHLLKEDIKHLIIMSGRGYHLLIFSCPDNIQNIKSTIYNAQMFFVNKLNLKCDRQVIGDASRLRRVPNTYNLKAKRFCIPLTKEQFSLLDDTIKILAHKQNFIRNITIGEKLFNIKQFDTETESKFLNEINLCNSGSFNFEDSLNADYINNCDDFIKQLLLKKEIGWNDRYLIILYFKERGFTREEVFNILKENLSAHKFKHCVKEERQLQYLFERDDLMFPDKYGIKIYK